MFLSRERKEIVILVYVLYQKFSRRNPVFFMIFSARPQLLVRDSSFFAVGKRFFLPICCIFVFYLVIFFQGTIQLGEYTFYFRKIISLYVVTQQYMYILKFFSNKVEIGKISLVT